MLIYFGIVFVLSYIESSIRVYGSLSVFNYNNSENRLMSSLFDYAAKIFILHPIALCLLSWFQRGIHIQDLSVGAMFDPVKRKYMSIVGTMALRYLYTILWTLLFIVPGFIKMYAYGMTEYIKAENPNIPASRAIEMSEIMTDGYKGKLFYLDLSFIGWWILSVFTFGILAVVYVAPYYYSARAFAYEELKAMAISTGRLSAEEFEPPYFSSNESNMF